MVGNRQIEDRRGRRDNEHTRRTNNRHRQECLCHIGYWRRRGTCRASTQRECQDRPSGFSHRHLPPRYELILRLMLFCTSRVLRSASSGEGSFLGFVVGVVCVARFRSASSSAMMSTDERTVTGLTLGSFAALSVWLKSISGSAAGEATGTSEMMRASRFAVFASVLSEKALRAGAECATSSEDSISSTSSSISTTAAIGAVLAVVDGG